MSGKRDPSMNHLFSTTLKSTQTHVPETPQAAVRGLGPLLRRASPAGQDGDEGEGRPWPTSPSPLTASIPGDRSLILPATPAFSLPPLLSPHCASVDCSLGFRPRVPPKTRRPTRCSPRLFWNRVCLRNASLISSPGGPRVLATRLHLLTPEFSSCDKGLAQAGREKLRPFIPRGLTWRRGSARPSSPKGHLGVGAAASV